MTQIHDMFIDEHLLEQVQFVHLFKVPVLHLHVIMMKPTRWKKVDLLYLPDSIEIASLERSGERLTLWCPQIHQSKRPVAW